MTDISEVFTARQIISVILLRHLYHAAKSYDMGQMSFLPPKKGVLRIFIAIKNPSSSAGFEPENLGLVNNH
jgi:hypothetical protein